MVSVIGTPRAGAVFEIAAPTSMMESVVTLNGVARLNVRPGFASTPTKETRPGPVMLGNGMNVMVVSSWLTTTGRNPIERQEAVSVKKVPVGAVMVTVSPSAGRESVIAASSRPGTTVTSMVLVRPRAFTLKFVWVSVDDLTKKRA